MTLTRGAAPPESAPLVPAARLVELARAADELALQSRALAAKCWREIERANIQATRVTGLKVRTPGPRSDVSPDDVRRARRVAKLSQAQLADEVRFSRGLIAGVEGGHRSVPLSLGEWAKKTLLGDEHPLT